jgi:hypothetical protein
VSPQARREAVEAMRAKTKISERRACELMGISRTVLHYERCVDEVNVGLAITDYGARRRAAALWVSAHSCAATA